MRDSYHGSHNKKKNKFDEYEIESAARSLKEASELQKKPALHS